MLGTGICYAHKCFATPSKIGNKIIGGYQNAI